MGLFDTLFYRMCGIPTARHTKDLIRNVARESCFYFFFFYFLPIGNWLILFGFETSTPIQSVAVNLTKLQQSSRKFCRCTRNYLIWRLVSDAFGGNEKVKLSRRIIIYVYVSGDIVVSAARGTKDMARRRRLHHTVQ